MSPAHIRAKPVDVASRVIVAGDPARVKQIASMLNDVKLVNENRGFFVYTGKYKDTPISVAVHGIGAPSLAIVFEELVMLGAKVVVRLGTAGAFIPDLHVGDVVIPTGAAYHVGGTLGMYFSENVALSCVPDFNLLRSIVTELEAHNIPYRAGPVFSSDAFYAENPAFAKTWANRGYLAVEMECATLFALGLLRKVHCAAALIISDNLVVSDEKELRTAKDLEKYIMSITPAILDALVKFKYNS